MGPELLEDSRPTEESDCYALGMVILEVLSSQVPFLGDSDFIVVRRVMDGERPKMPEEAWFTKDVWRILECCWAPKPRDRPSLGDVLQCLRENSPSWETFFPPSTPSTPNSFRRELPDQGRALTTNLSQVSSPSWEVVSQSAQELVKHGSSSGPGNTQVRSFIHPRIPVLTSAFQWSITSSFPINGPTVFLNWNLRSRI